MEVDGTNNDFNTNVVITIVATIWEKIGTFFKVIFMKVKAEEICHTCLQKMFNKFIATLVTDHNVDLLENLFEINFMEWEDDDFNPKMENLPALVKACMNDNYETVISSGMQDLSHKTNHKFTSLDQICT